MYFVIIIDIMINNNFQFTFLPLIILYFGRLFVPLQTNNENDQLKQRKR